MKTAPCVVCGLFRGTGDSVSGKSVSTCLNLIFKSCMHHKQTLHFHCSGVDAHIRDDIFDIRQLKPELASCQAEECTLDESTL